MDFQGQRVIVHFFLQDWVSSGFFQLPDFFLELAEFALSARIGLVYFLLSFSVRVDKLALVFSYVMLTLNFMVLEGTSSYYVCEGRHC